MYTCWKCMVTVRFDDDDVREYLNVDDDYEITYADRKAYAWECIENEDCEYGSVELS